MMKYSYVSWLAFQGRSQNLQSEKTKRRTSAPKTTTDKALEKAKIIAATTTITRLRKNLESAPARSISLAAASLEMRTKEPAHEKALVMSQSSPSSCFIKLRVFLRTFSSPHRRFHLTYSL